MHFRNLLFVALLLLYAKAYSQQDVDFHINTHFFIGKKILKVKRDIADPYVWVLAQNNGVYRINSQTLVVDDYSANFMAYVNVQMIDIQGYDQDTACIVTKNSLITCFNGVAGLPNPDDVITATINSIGIDNLAFERGLQRGFFIGANSGLYYYGLGTDALISRSVETGYSSIYESTYRKLTMADYLSLGVGFDTTKVSIIDEYTAYTNDVSTIWKGGQFGTRPNTVTFVPRDNGALTTIGTNIFWGTDSGFYRKTNNYYLPALGNYTCYLPGIKVNKINDILGLMTINLLDSAGYPFTKDNILIGTNKGLYFSQSIFYTPRNYSLDTLALHHYDGIGQVAVNDICINPISTTLANTSYTYYYCEDGVWVATDDGLYLLNPDYGKYIDPTERASAINFDLPNGDTLSIVKICSGSSVSILFDPYAVNNNTIQWQKNGKDIAGQTGTSLTVTDSGNYNAILYSPCGDVHIETNQLKVDVISSPVFSFNYPDTIQQCYNTPQTLKTENTPGYRYRWYANGALNSDTTASFVASVTGKYYVEVSACPGSWVPSKEVTVNFIQLPTPVIKTNKSVYCIGDNATLSIGTPVNNSYTINWFRDNILLPDNTNLSSSTTNIPGNYAVSIVNNNPNTDGTICSQTSAIQSLLFNLSPTVTISEIIKTTICDGQAIDLKAIHSAGTVKWSTEETTDQISVTTGGTYRVTVTSTAGCIADTSIIVTFLPNPVLNVKDTSICPFKREPITLFAPSGYASYAWNGLAGNQTYEVSLPETVSLTVTDANGCQTTQQITVADKCPEIVIPNAFTPNNDGINDTWDIEGLNSDQSVVVRVFSRYGTQVYQSNGYGSPWNGNSGSKKLPPGVYYYILTAKNGTQKFSGSVTIIY